MQNNKMHLYLRICETTSLRNITSSPFVVWQAMQNSRQVCTQPQTFGFSLHFQCFCRYFVQLFAAQAYPEETHKTRFIIIFMVFVLLLPSSLVCLLFVADVHPSVQAMKQSTKQLGPSCTSNFLWLSKCMNNFSWLRVCVGVCVCVSVIQAVCIVFFQWQ